MSAGSKAKRLAEAARHRTVLDNRAEAGARVYAEALMNVAASQGNAEQVIEELDAIVSEVIDPHPELDAVLASPTIAVHERDRIIVRLFEGRVLPIVLNFLRVLNRRGRFSWIRAAAQQARAILDRRLNRRAVRVVTAAPLDDTQQAALRERLEKLLGATPVLKVETDSSLLGGMLIQSGDELFDASLRGQLERLKRRLLGDRLQALRGRLAEAATST